MALVRVFALLLLGSAAAAQQYVISTVAGGAPPATPVRGLDLSINTRAVAADAAGNAYFTTGEFFGGSPPIQGLPCVFKLGWHCDPSRGKLPAGLLRGWRAGSVSGQVAGLIGVNVKIPDGVRSGGYVPVVIEMGEAGRAADAVWIAISGNYTLKVQ